MNTQQITKNAITLKGSAVIIADYLSKYASILTKFCRLTMPLIYYFLCL